MAPVRLFKFVVEALCFELKLVIEPPYVLPTRLVVEPPYFLIGGATTFEVARLETEPLRSRLLSGRERGKDRPEREAQHPTQLNYKLNHKLIHKLIHKLNHKRKQKQLVATHKNISI